jgi:hypothetical protein
MRKYLFGIVVLLMIVCLPLTLLAQEDASKEEVTIVVTHAVTDFETWLPAFESHADMRNESGVTGITVYQAADDGNMVTAIATCGSLEAALAFIGSEDLKEAMKASGVVGEPTIQIIRKHKEYDF